MKDMDQDATAPQDVTAPPEEKPQRYEEYGHPRLRMAGAFLFVGAFIAAQMAGWVAWPVAFGIVGVVLAVELFRQPAAYRAYRERWSREHGGAAPLEPRRDSGYWMATGWRRVVSLVLLAALLAVVLLHPDDFGGWLFFAVFALYLGWCWFGAVFVHDGGPGTSASRPEDPPRPQSA